MHKRQFTGKFKMYDPHMKSIALIDLSDFKTKKYYSRSAEILIDEINRIYLIDDDSAKDGKSGSSNLSQSEDKVVLTEKEIQCVQESLCNFTYITQINQEYFRAVDVLRHSEKIALDVIGGRKGRFSRGSLMALGTRERIFLLDLMNIGNIPPEIRQILEARIPQKIVHDSCTVADFLRVKHNISITNVSDTWIAHTALTGSTNPITVSECIQRHLRVPVSKITTNHEFTFDQRPLDINQCALAAEQVAYLLHLNTHLLEGNLFKPYYDACTTYKNGISQFDNPAFVAVRVGANNFQNFINNFHLFEPSTTKY
ncbi:hypothetical protein DMENIID0001_000440 [Sergentomyia squamirostris]